jgi:PhzF family phenazine biosynthesis protein
MKINRVSAFSYNNEGGNPAGVIICDNFPTDDEMLNTAKEVGYSETAFLKGVNDGWMIRYFAPEMEIPFCGHATIASTAVLGEKFGEGNYKLYLNKGDINVSVLKSEKGIYTATLQSPKTYSEKAPEEYVNDVLNEFSLTHKDVNPDYPMYFAFAGAKHLIVVLKEHSKLKEMKYNFDRLKNIMQKESLTTISLLWQESENTFHSRNPFPPGGVYEDAATGAAAAALAGYLRDIQWKENNSCFEIIQGEDMGCTSHLFVEYTAETGSSIKVSGETRHIVEEKR